jgi:methanogenic corrinoid protein MtbC1
MQSKIKRRIYEEYEQRLLNGERGGCRQIVEALIADGVDIRDLYMNLFQRSMYQIGRMWETNQISVAVEHLATSITMHLLNIVYPLLFSERKKEKTALIACVANEYHQLGSQMVSDIFELNGWNGYFLGGNTPIDDLLKYIDAKKPDVLGLSLAIYFNMQSLWNTVEKVRREYPHLPVLVGGQAFLWGGREITDEYGNLHYASNINELEKLIGVLEA